MAEKDRTTTNGGGEHKGSEKNLETLIALVGDTNRDLKKVSDVDEGRQIESEQELKERETHRVGNEHYYALRDKWSKYIAYFIAAMLMFQFLLTLALGLGWKGFDLNNYKTFLYIVVGENFAQILAMGYIVANYLFPKEKSSK